MSFKDQVLKFKSRGLTLIEGENSDEGDSNGSGKSSVFDAICWCLFGTTVRGAKHSEVVNWSVGKDCHVGFNFKVRGGSYTVDRYRDCEDLDDAGKAYDNRLIVLKDGVKIEKSTTAQTQEWLLADIGIDFDLFRCTVIFSQGETFNFVNATDKQQKEILSKIRRINLDAALKASRSRLKRIEDERSGYERDLAVLQSHVKSEEDLEALKSQADNWESDRAERVKLLEQRIRGFQAQLDKAKASCGDLKLLQKEIDDLNLKIKKLDDMKVEVSSKIAKIETVVGQAERVIERKSKIGTVCPTCEQGVDNLSIASFVNGEKERIDKLKSHMDVFAAKKKKIMAVMNETISDGLELTARLRALRSEVDAAGLIKSNLDETNARRNTVCAEANHYLNQYAEVVEKQKKIAAKIEVVEGKLTALKEREPYYRFWETAFGDKGIKSFVFDTICGALTAKANHYINILTNGSLTVSFDTQTKLKGGGIREKFECVIAKDGKNVPYNNYSGGEKTRVSLAVDMALSDLMSDFYGSAFNIVVFDEQDLYLDDQGRNSYLTLLEELSRDRHVFVVSHDSSLKSKFEDTWTVRKSKGFSKVVWE